MVTDEGRTRINRNPGYYVAWHAMLPGTTRMVVRARLHADPARGDPSAPGAVLELLTTHAGGVNSTADVGSVGALKKPLRSFGSGRSGRIDRLRRLRQGRHARRAGRGGRGLPGGAQPRLEAAHRLRPRDRGEKRSSAQITNYAREELEGRLVVAVVNFPPRQVGPVMSEVLVLGAVADDHPVRAARARRGLASGRPDRLGARRVRAAGGGGRVGRVCRRADGVRGVSRSGAGGRVARRLRVIAGRRLRRVGRR